MKQLGDGVYTLVGRFSLDIRKFPELLAQIEVVFPTDATRQQRLKQRRKVHCSMRSRWRSVTLT